MVKTWLVVPGVEKLFFLEAKPIAEALEAYREGKVHQAARILSGAEAHCVRTRDDRLPSAVKKAAQPGRHVLFRGNLNEVLASKQVKRVEEVFLGILLEGLPEEEEDLPISVRYFPDRCPSDHFLYFLAHECLLAPVASKPPLEAFPGLEEEKGEA